MKTLRVMVIDDEPGTRLGISRALHDFRPRLDEVTEQIDYTVTEAESGESAIDRMRDDPPDILLVDYRLPGISGLEVIEQIRQRKLDALAIMITAYGSLDTAVAATSHGAYDFLAKPFTPDDLKRVIGQATVRLLLARQAEQLAEERRRARARLIRVLGHELKAPLAAVEGYLRMIRQRQAGNDLPAYDAMLDRSLIRLDGMRTLITDLLDMTRLEAGRRDRVLRQVDVASLARKAIDTVMPQAAARRIAIRLHATDPTTMLADPVEIEIMLNNLLSNAVKYNRDDGNVLVTIDGDEDRLCIAVADTGIGIADRDLPGLFGEFTRIRNEQTCGILGSGLGLSIVERLAGGYGGSALVHSEPNVGSTFTVALKRDCSATDGSWTSSTGSSSQPI